MNFWQKNRNNPLVRTGINYSIVGTIQSVTTMLVGILIMRWLSPQELGLWNAVSIFIAYVPFFQLGIQSALNRDLPVLLGKGDKDNAVNLVQNGKGFAFLLFLLFIVTGLVLTIIFSIIGKSTEFILGIVAVSIMAAFQSIQLHLIATYRSAKAFDKLTRIYIVNTILIVGLVYFIYRYHYYGILIYNVGTSVIMAILMTRMAPYRGVKSLLQIKPLFGLAKTGLILMSFIQMRSFAITIPKWLILSVGGVVKLGLYSPALAINGLMNMLPGQIAQFFHPQMGYKYGQTGNARDMWKYVKKMLIIFPLISIPVCVLIWVFTPWLLHTFFPKYIASEWAMKIMAIAFVFSSAFTTHGVLYTIKAYKFAYIYSIVEVIGYFIFPFLFVKTLNYDILTSITLGLVVNNFILYMLNIVLLRKALFLPEFNVGVKKAEYIDVN